MSERIHIMKKHVLESFDTTCAPVFMHGFPFPMSGPGAMDILSKGIPQAISEWLSAEMAKVMPPDLFLRAYGTLDCKRDAAQWVRENGHMLKIHPDRHELWQHNHLLNTFRLSPDRPGFSIPGQ